MSVTTDRVADLVAPVAERLGLSVYDIDQPGGSLRVMLDKAGGIDIDSLSEATREISAALDEAEPLAGSYTLEVSSPGLERPLRTAAHFSAAVGEPVKVKLHPAADGPRRADGRLVAVDPDDGTVVIESDSGTRTVAIADVTKAHTVFEWAPAPKPGKSKGAKSKRAGQKADSSGTPEPSAGTGRSAGNRNSTTESSEDTA